MESKHILLIEIPEDSNFAGLNLVVMPNRKKNACNYFTFLQIKYLYMAKRTIRFLSQN